MDLVTVYFALVRSVSEYCCVTWATSLPVHLSDKIERAQKRALPGFVYCVSRTSYSIVRLSSSAISLVSILEEANYASEWGLRLPWPRDYGSHLKPFPQICF